MANLKYYRDENARHPALGAERISFATAQSVIERLCREHEIVGLAVERTSGSRHSHYQGPRRAGTPGGKIRLNVDGLNWLTVIHEFAHALDDADRAREAAAWQKAEAEFCTEMRERFPIPATRVSGVSVFGQHSFGSSEVTVTGTATPEYRAWLKLHPRPMGRRWHGATHAEFVDMLARKVATDEWRDAVSAEIAARIARDLARNEARRERAAKAQDPAVVRVKKIEKRKEQIARLSKRLKALTTRLRTARRSLAALERAERKVKP